MKKVSVIALVILVGALAGCNKNSTTTTGPSEAYLTGPTEVRAEATTAGVGGIIVNWSKVEGAEKYYIYWDTFQGVSKSKYKGKEENTSGFFIHTQLEHPRTYYYVVTAVNAAGESGVSTEVKDVW